MKNTGGGHRSHPTVRLMRRSTTFSLTEGMLTRRLSDTILQQWFDHRLLRAKVRFSRKLKKKICQRVEKDKTGDLLTICDSSIEET
ncbi:unnamed protein product [Strongylus vulgaris]|uniref:Uncharacterized protein n=1 Tax=Strongylus vulgaris TaxID=40348 RepID=A0A3P7JNP6_STRVU|nr:unnamed protein product [Strongylus vulgaris]